MHQIPEARQLCPGCRYSNGCETRSLKQGTFGAYPLPAGGWLSTHPCWGHRADVPGLLAVVSDKKCLQKERIQAQEV